MAIDTLDTMIAEGRLIRGAWTGTDAHGRETACLLAALAPECGREGSAAVCPASVMPAWLAHLTPWIDDAGTLEAWPAMVRRYADVARRWHVLDAAAWQRAQWRVRIACVEEALRHVTVDKWGVRSACEQVIAVFRAAGETGAVDEAACSTARSAAWSAACSAAESTARSAAWSAAESAAWSTAASVAWSTAASAARSAAESAAVDRLTAAILAILEDECTRAGA
jgi:hypothetical protein